MGCANPVQVSEATKHLTVVTLNYSGILNSPYEYYSEDNQAQQKILSQIFKKLIPKYFSDFNQSTFKWNVGKIDQRMQKERYSPSYRPDVGIQNNKFITKQRFQELWNATFQIQIKKIQQLSFTPQEKHRMMLFDLITYHAILKQIYKVQQIQQAVDKDVNEYVKHNNKYFCKSYLDSQKKQKKVIKALQTYNADIFCFQEPTAEFIDEVLKNNKFQIAFNEKDKSVSIIIVRKQKFKVFHKNSEKLTLLTEQQIKSLNWDNDTSYMFIDNIMIMSTHLTSKKDKNAIQVEQIKSSLKLLRSKYPFLSLIICGDMNSCIESIQGFNIYPNDKKEFTNAKKRTMIQPQYNKGDLLSKDIKDQIITTLQIQRKRITTILNKKRQESTFLPAEEHPFDHYLVECTLKIPSEQIQQNGQPKIHPVN